MMPLMLAPGTGSIRSVQSMPMLAHGSHMGLQPAHTWDGEPCPVHHSHGHGMMPPHPMMPMAALYGMPGHPYGPAMSMPGKNLFHDLLTYLNPLQVATRCPSR